MSLQKAKILSGLDRLRAAESQVLDAEVTNVDEGTMTCSVRLPNGQEIDDVHLKAMKESSDAVVTIPKKGADIQMIRLKAGWMMISCDVVDKVKGKIGTSEFEMDKDGYRIKRGSEDLKTIMNDLLDAMIQATYTNGAGTTSPANNVSVMQQIKQRIPKLLK